MAKKKPTSKKTQKSQPPLQPAFDPRSMEQVMRDLTRMLNEGNFESEEEINQFLAQQVISGGPLPPAQPRSDLDFAQDLVYQAYDTSSKLEKIKLARAALNISLDCADAYVLLAELVAETVGEAIALYEAGVKAGQRALGSDFEELKGNFWGFIETRPYMRARHGLAMTLQAIGRLDEAAGHLEAMLELNPGDNQGIRYNYISLLLELNQSERIEKLLNDYPDEWSATWKYSHALFEFRKTGKGDKANTLLLDAIDYNPHVPPYLIGKKKLPKQRTYAFYSPGDESEALEYLSDGMGPWTQTKGAVEWLKQVMAERDKPDKPA